MPQSTRQSGKGNSVNNEGLVRTRAKRTFKLKLVRLFSEGPDTVFIGPESLGVRHVVGSNLFVGGASDLVKTGMDFVKCTIAFGAFSADINEIYSIQIF